MRKVRVSDQRRNYAYGTFFVLLGAGLHYLMHGVGGELIPAALITLGGSFFKNPRELVQEQRVEAETDGT